MKTTIKESETPCTMLVVAAGRGRRFGGDLPKQYQEVNGKPLLFYTLQALHDHPLINTIIPVIGASDAPFWGIMKPLLDDLPKVLAPVPGDDERQYSVLNGLRALNLPKPAWVGIHDGVRPLISRPVLDRLLAARDRSEALIAAIPAQDTIKQTQPIDKIQPHDNQNDPTIIKTVDRSNIWLAQTPQIFRFGAIRQLHEEARRENFLGTDDASLVERAGGDVHLIQGDPRNIKITRNEDLPMAAYLLNQL